MLVFQIKLMHKQYKGSREEFKKIKAQIFFFFKAHYLEGGFYNLMTGRAAFSLWFSCENLAQDFWSLKVYSPRDREASFSGRGVNLMAGPRKMAKVFLQIGEFCLVLHMLLPAIVRNAWFSDPLPRWPVCWSSSVPKAESNTGMWRRWCSGKGQLVLQVVNISPKGSTAV